MHQSFLDLLLHHLPLGCPFYLFGPCPSMSRSPPLLKTLREVNMGLCTGGELLEVLGSCFPSFGNHSHALSDIAVPVLFLERR